MRFARILDLIYCQVWMITQAAHVSVGQLALSVYQREQASLADLATGLPTPQDASRGVNLFTRQPLPTMQIVRGTAIIPMSGTMVRGADQIEKSCGFVDVEDVQRDLDEAEASDDVKRIVLDIDSPGGMHNGAAELAYRIKSSSKEVIAWTAGSMASAAYFVGSSAKSIFAAPSAMVGSIGSYIALLDSSRAYEMAGYKVELFKAGEFKGAGTPGLELTESQREYIQSIVDDANAQFHAHVKAARPGVKAAVMDGRSFYADQAFKHGLIDGTANSLGALLKMFR